MSGTLARSFSRSNLGFNADPAKVAEKARLAKLLDAEALENWDNPAWHRQVAQDVSDTLTYGFTNTNQFGSYIATKTVGEFDRDFIRERRGLSVYSTARGGSVDESQLRDEMWEVPRDTMGFAISEFEDNIRSGFAATLEEILPLAEARLQAEQYRRLFQLAQTAVPNTSPYYSSTSGLSQVAVNASLRAAKDVVNPDGVGLAPVTIFGRATMTDQIADFAGFAPEAVEEIRLTGRLGVYRGANVVTVSHYTDEDGVSFLPNNELWILGGNAGRWVNFGGLRVKSWVEDTVDYYRLRGTVAVGGILTHPEQTHRLIDSSQNGS